MASPSSWHQVKTEQSWLLRCKNTRDLIRCQWPVAKALYVGFRVVTAVGLLIFYLYLMDVVFSRSVGWKFFIYLTSWGYTLMTLTYVIKAILVVLNEHTLDNNIKPVRFPQLVHFTWLLSNISTTINFLITASFWLFLRKYISQERLYSFSNINQHVLNSVWSLLDLILTASPTYLLHFYQPLSVGLIYAFFSYIYYLEGGTDVRGRPWIYLELDWSEPQIALVQGVLKNLFVLLLCYLVTWSIARLRQWLYHKLYLSKRKYNHLKEKLSEDVEP